MIELYLKLWATYLAFEAFAFNKSKAAELWYMALLAVLLVFDSFA